MRRLFLMSAGLLNEHARRVYERTRHGNERLAAVYERRRGVYERQPVLYERPGKVYDHFRMNLTIKQKSIRHIIC